MTGLRYQFDSNKFNRNKSENSGICPVSYLKEVTSNLFENNLNRFNSRFFEKNYCFYKLLKRNKNHDVQKISSDNFSIDENYLLNEKSFNKLLNQAEKSFYRNNKKILLQITDPFAIESPNFQYEHITSSKPLKLHNTASKNKDYCLDEKRDSSCQTSQKSQNLFDKPHQNEETCSKKKSASDVSEQVFKKLYQIKQQLHIENLNHDANKLVAKGDFSAAVKIWKNLVNLDNTHQKALYNLALCYEKGLGVDKDYNRVCDFYKFH